MTILAWLYKTDPLMIISDCLKTAGGLEYSGTVSVTKKGNTCLSWFDAGYTDSSFTVDGTAKAAKNYCRYA